MSKCIGATWGEPPDKIADIRSGIFYGFACTVTCACKVGVPCKLNWLETGIKTGEGVMTPDNFPAVRKRWPEIPCESGTCLSQTLNFSF